MCVALQVQHLICFHCSASALGRLAKVLSGQLQRCSLDYYAMHTLKAQSNALNLKPISSIFHLTTPEARLTHIIPFVPTAFAVNLLVSGHTSHSSPHKLSISCLS